MKIVARIREPEKITARFKEVVLSKADRYDEGYKDGYKEGEAAGYTEGEKHGSAEASSFYDDRISAELAEVNDVIQTHGDSKAETLEQISKAVSTTIGAASMKAQTVGYAQGVDDTNVQRDAKDAELVAEFNDHLGGYGTPVDSVEKIPGATYDVIRQVYNKGTRDGRALEGFDRDAIDASRLAEINVALTENGGTAAETLDGVDEKIPEVHAAGMQSEYDRFWDAFQMNGNREGMQYCFAGNGWTAETFKPKHKIYPVYANQLFIRSENLKISLPEHLAAVGVELDFSRCVAISEFLAYSGIYEIGEMDLRTLGSMNYVFSAAQNLETVQHLIMKSEGSQGFNEASFRYCYALKNLTISGVIGQSGMNLQWSTLLSRASIESIIAALSATASGKSITLSKTAVNAAFTTDEWNALAGTKTNWTISLV